MGEDEESQGNYRFHKKYLTRLKFIFLILYILVNPTLETPRWCIDGLKSDSSFSRGSVGLNCDHLGVPYSGNPTISPTMCAILDFACLAFFLYFRWFKTKWEKKREGRKLRNILLSISVAIIFIENLIVMIIFARPILSPFLRPFVFACFLHLVRLNARHFYHDLKDSAVILVTIFLFIAMYALIGHFLFRYRKEGYDYFATISDSNFNMLILMTTANFPDIMLPAYSKSYWVMLYFVSYLCIGLYLMMNFLLANVFNRFKDRLEKQA